MKNCRVIFSKLSVIVLSFGATLAYQPSLITNAQTANTSSVAQNTTKSENPCSVHLWDGKNYTDDNIVIKAAGRYSNLRNLPNANNQDWSDEADSLKVGSAATVKLWADENFTGASQTLKPGTQIPNLSEEPESIEITCK